MPGTPPVECGKLMWFPLTSQVLLFNQYELCIMDLCIERLRSLIYVHVDIISGRMSEKLVIAVTVGEISWEVVSRDWK